MKKILSKTLIFGLTTNMLASSYAMDVPGWVNGTNCTKPNTCLVTQDPTSGLFELVLNNLTVQQPNPIYSPLPYIYNQSAPQAAAANEWTASTYISLLGALTGIGALGYTIFSNYWRNPLTKFKIKVKNRINGIETIVSDPANGLANKVDNLEKQDAIHNAEIKKLEKLGAITDNNGQIKTTLDQRLKDMMAEGKKVEKKINDECLNIREIEKLLYGDALSTDSFKNQGLVRVVKNKISEAEVKQFLTQHTEKTINEKLVIALTTKDAAINLLTTQVQSLDQQIKELKKEINDLNERFT